MGNDKQVVVIDVYNDDGERCEGIVGAMSGEDIRAEMRTILEEDGIPVLRASSTGIRHAVEEATGAAAEFGGALKLHWKCNGVEFRAEGQAEDVITAHMDYLEALAELIKEGMIHG